MKLSDVQFRLTDGPTKVFYGIFTDDGATYFYGIAEVEQAFESYFKSNPGKRVVMDEFKTTSEAMKKYVEFRNQPTNDSRIVVPVTPEKQITTGRRKTMEISENEDDQLEEKTSVKKTKIGNETNSIRIQPNDILNKFVINICQNRAKMEITSFFREN